eukprot:TRINITY_DN7243_c0_g1_i1.p1 TRINITY_DN7243_c0_g1~~TRINITY_DN7243_c0_g1_i1.p1  ORF type:complete len:1206 (+),score=338.35 TRINITY_DN7243_c0_g1_i1:92-3709(+)
MYFVTGPGREYIVRGPGVADVAASPAGDLVLVVTAAGVQLWAAGPQRLRLATWPAPPEHGELLRATWRPDGKCACVITDKGVILLLSIDHSSRRRPGGGGVRWHPDQSTVEIDTAQEAVRAANAIGVERGGELLALCGDAERLCIATGSGHLVSCPWEPRSEGGATSVTSAAVLLRSGGGLEDDAEAAAPQRVTHLSCSLTWPGMVAATFSPWGGSAVLRFEHDTPQPKAITLLRTPVSGPVALNGRRRLVALCGEGATVELRCATDLSDRRATLSLEHLGWGRPALGHARLLRWSADEDVLVCAFEARGLALWHWSGVLLHTSLLRGGAGALLTPQHRPSVHPRQAAAAPAESSAATTGGYNHQTSVACVEWGACGYVLFVVPQKRPDRLLQLDLIKAAVATSPAQNRGPHVLLASPRGVWLFRHSDADFAQGSWEPVPAPPAYAEVNYPLRYAACSDDGSQICVAGRRGCALYSRPLRRWRIFGVQEQEQEVEVTAAPIWCSNLVICLPSRAPPSRRDAGEAAHELLFYPRFHLDRNSCLLRVPLPAPPRFADSVALPGGGLAVAVMHAAPGGGGGGSHVVTYLHLTVLADSLARPSKAALQVQSHQEFAVAGIAEPCSVMRLLPPAPGRDAGLPSLLTLHGTRGELRVAALGRDARPPAVITTGVIACWIDPRLAPQGLVHIVAWAARGTQLLAVSLPSAARPAALVSATQLSDTDSEALPVGVLTGEGLVVSAAGGARHDRPLGGGRPSFHVAVRTLPYAHAILLALFLQPPSPAAPQGAVTPGALPGLQAPGTDSNGACREVAHALREHACFVDAMDYLLHSVLHCDEIIDTGPGGAPVDRQRVLRRALSFLSGYGEFHAALVHCLRKADPGTWPLVFAECPPTRLFASAVRSGCVREAALLVRVLQAPHGGDGLKDCPETALRALRLAAAAARQLFPLTVARHEFDLAADLLRFLRLLRGELVRDVAPHTLGPEHVEPGLVSLVEGDPLLGSAWLRSSVCTEGRRLLASARLRRLSGLLDSLGLATSPFVNKQWPACCAAFASAEGIERVFDELHLEFGLPRATRALPVLGGPEEALQRAAGQPMVLRQWRQGGGDEHEAAEVLGNPTKCVSPTQVYLVLVPPALRAVKAARQVCAAAGCTPLVLLLSCLLMDVSAVRGALADAPAELGALWRQLFRRERNAAYRPLLALLDASKADAL